MCKLSWEAGRRRARLCKAGSGQTTATTSRHQPNRRGAERAVAFAAGSHLQPPIQRPLNGHALAGVSSVGGYGRDQRIQLVFLLLELFHEALDGALGERFALSALAMAHQAVDNAQTSVITCRRVSNRHIVHLSQLWFGASFSKGSLGRGGAAMILRRMMRVDGPAGGYDLGGRDSSLRSRLCRADTEKRRDH